MPVSGKWQIKHARECHNSSILQACHLMPWSITSKPACQINKEYPRQAGLHATTFQQQVGGMISSKFQQCEHSAVPAYKADCASPVAPCHPLSEQVSATPLQTSSAHQRESLQIVLLPMGLNQAFWRLPQRLQWAFAALWLAKRSAMDIMSEAGSMAVLNSTKQSPWTTAKPSLSSWLAEPNL